MTIQELIKQIEIRLEYLKNLKVSYIQLDNTEMVLKTEQDINETEQTLNTLKNS
jgi:hypothetical protein